MKIDSVKSVMYMFFIGFFFIIKKIFGCGFLIVICLFFIYGECVKLFLYFDCSFCYFLNMCVGDMLI